MIEPTLWQRSLKDTCGSPGMSLAIVFLAFGASLRSAGLDFFQSLAMNVLVYAVPGQLVALNGILTGLSIASTVLLVAIINIRLLPMAFSLSHHLKHSNPSPPLYYFAAYFVAVTGWMNFFTNYRSIAPKDAFSYFMYTCFFLWCAAMAGFLLGYHLVDFIPNELFVGLLLVNPLYFLMVIASHGRDDRYLAIAVVGGCIFFLPFVSVSGNLAILFAGLTGGGLAFATRLYDRLRENRS